VKFGLKIQMIQAFRLLDKMEDVDGGDDPDAKKKEGCRYIIARGSKNRSRWKSVLLLVLLITCF